MPLIGIRTEFFCNKFDKRIKQNTICKTFKSFCRYLGNFQVYNYNSIHVYVLRFLYLVGISKLHIPIKTVFRHLASRNIGILANIAKHRDYNYLEGVSKIWITISTSTSFHPSICYLSANCLLSPFMCPKTSCNACSHITKCH